MPVQGLQPCFLFLRQTGSIRIGPALDPLPGVGCSGQIFLLGTQRLQRRISLRISPIQVRKFPLPPPDLPAQPLQIFLLQAQRLLGIGLPDLFPQKCLLRSFFIFLPVQGVNLLANRFQQLLFLCRAVNGRFQLPAFPAQLGGLASLALEEFQALAVFLELFHGGIIVIQIVGVLHQIGQLCANGSRGRDLPVGKLGNKGAPGKGIPVQLKKFLSQVLRKRGALRAVCQVRQRKAILLLSKIASHPVSVPPVFKFQKAAVFSPLPGVIVLAFARLGTGFGQPIKHGLEKRRQGALSETVLPAEHIEALRKRKVKVGQNAEILHMAPQ